MPIVPVQTRRLTDGQLALLSRCWTLLEQATRGHAPVCECRLCCLRAECLIEDEEGTDD